VAGQEIFDRHIARDAIRPRQAVPFIREQNAGDRDFARPQGSSNHLIAFCLLLSMAVEIRAYPATGQKLARDLP
jgi:hypothetical protein